MPETIMSESPARGLSSVRGSSRGARTDEDSPKPVAPNSPGIDASMMDAEDDHSLQAVNRKLSKALNEADLQIGHLTVEHKREIDRLRSELERSVLDRQQLEKMVEEARNDQLAAEDTVTQQAGGAAEANTLRVRLANEAEATRRLRDELDETRQALLEAQRDAAGKSEVARQAKADLDTLRLQLQNVNEQRNQEGADFDDMLTAAINARRDAEAESARLRRQVEELTCIALVQAGEAEAGPNKANGPNVPMLDLRGRLSNQTASPHTDPTTASARETVFNHSYTRFAINSARDVSPESPMMSAREEALARRWARRRGGSFSEDPTPRTSVTRPLAEDSAACVPNEQSPLMQQVNAEMQVNADMLVGGTPRDTHLTSPRMNAPAAARRRQKKNGCPCQCFVS